MSALLVPMEINALYLAADQHGIMSPLARFDGLPWVEMGPEGPRDRNPDRAFTSQAAIKQPFAENAHVLEAGVHLHWLMPKALTMGRHRGDGSAIGPLEFPAVPNRWLIVRRIGGEVTRRWIVESDYLWPEGTPWRPGLTSYPVGGTYHGLRDPSHRPYRFLGRVLDLDQPIDSGGQHLGKLTALGYGEPQFAALYPNCQSVFGLHDGLEDLSSHNESFLGLQLKYEVYGGYATAEVDPIWQRARANDAPSDEYVQELSKDFGWNIQDGDASISSLICVGKVSFERGTDEVLQPETQASNTVELAFGNSGTEALSALLATKLENTATTNGQNLPPKTTLEHQLEALHLMDATRGEKIDLGAKFLEARHAKSFQHHEGGTIWSLRPKSHSSPDRPSSSQIRQNDLYEQAQAHSDAVPSRRADQTNDDKHSRHSHALPGGVAHALNALNIAQANFDRAQDEIQSLREMINAEWHKYIECCYRPDYMRQGYPDIDVVKQHIEGLIAMLDARLEFVGQLDSKPHTQSTRRVVAVLMERQKLRKVTLPKSVLDAEFDSWRAKIQDHRPASSLAQKLANRAAFVIFILDQLSILGTGARGLAAQLKSGKPLQQDDAIAHIQELGAALRALRALPEWSDYLVDELASAGIPADILDTPSTISQFLMNADETVKKSVFLAIDNLSEIPSMEPNAGPAPRYYQPNNPVILMAGTGTQETHPRNASSDDQVSRDQDGQPLCYVAQDLMSSFEQGWQAFADINETIDFVIGQQAHPRWATKSTGGSPWRPMMVEWEVSLEPKRGNLPSNRRQLPANFVQANYQLKTQDCEFLKLRDDAEPTIEARNFITGRSMLGAHAGVLLRGKVDRYLAKQMSKYLGDIAKERTLSAPESHFLDKLNRADTPAHELADWLTKYLSDAARADQFVDWCDAVLASAHRAISAREDTSQSVSPVRGLIAARLYVDRQAPLFLAQGLNGFNEALLMHQRCLQFEPADPLGFDGYREFSEITVNEATKNAAHTAPLLGHDFIPIRSGNATLRRLQLIDSFGRIAKINTTVNAAKSVSFGGRDTQNLALPPRITQPARVRFNWVSAQNDEVETNSHSLTSPICGWLICDNFNLGLFVFDADGQSLGEIDSAGTWRAAPGSTGLAGEIENKHLRKCVAWILSQCRGNTDFLADYVDELATALDNIDPEDVAQHKAAALLMSRPLALVRASFGVELKGLPATDQSWDALQQVLNGQAPSTAQIETVRFPVRIGEHQQLNDGVAGLWVDNHSRFISPQNDLTQNLVARIADGPQTVSFLIDPRGLAHCTTGVLPTVSLRIESTHYARAFNKLQPRFQVAPILAQPGAIDIPLSGKDWCFEAYRNGLLVSHSTALTISKADISSHSANGAEYWRVMVDNGWLTVLPDDADRAVVVPKDQRPQLPSEYAAQLPGFERLIANLATQLVRSDSRAHLNSITEIHEGWLTMPPPFRDVT